MTSTFALPRTHAASSYPICPACQTGQAIFSFTKGKYDLFRCEDCSFLFVHPFPSPAEIDEHYKLNYRGASASFYPKANSRRRRGFIRSLKFIRYAYKKDVLDLGCGGGFMAEAFARLGANASGLDISENSVAYARQHFPQCQFYCENFGDFRSRGLTYDFVFSSEVLEHLPGPTDFMLTLSQIVRPNGFVYLSAPDAGHSKVPADISSWSDICPPEHLEFFAAANLDILFHRYGFSLHRRFSSKTPAHSVIYKKIATSPML